jgi:hypothetical protein
MMFVYILILLESMLKSGLLLSGLFEGENCINTVGAGIAGVGIIPPTLMINVNNKDLKSKV